MSEIRTSSSYGFHLRKYALLNSEMRLQRSSAKTCDPSTESGEVIACLAKMQEAIRKISDKLQACSDVSEKIHAGR